MLTIFGVALSWPIVFCVGLVIGWFVLPAPSWVTNIWAALGLAKKVT